MDFHGLPWICLNFHNILIDIKDIFKHKLLLEFSGFTQFLVGCHSMLSKLIGKFEIIKIDIRHELPVKGLRNKLSTPDPTLNSKKIDQIISWTSWFWGSK